jgi:hypothetical protein
MAVAPFRVEPHALGEALACLLGLKLAKVCLPVSKVLMRWGVTHYFCQLSTLKNTKGDDLLLADFFCKWPDASR